MRSTTWVLVAFLATTGALAQQPSPRVTALLRHGVELRQQGQDEAALREFRAADAITHEPRITAQIGLAEQALQRWLDARQHLREALAATQDDYIIRHREVLAPALTEVETHLGSLVVIGAVSGAVLRIDGLQIGVLPMTEPVFLAAGSVAIELTAPGFATVSRTVRLEAGRVSRERVSMPDLRASTTVTRPTHEAPPVDTPRAEMPTGQRTAGLVTLIGGIAIGSSGAVLLGLSQRAIASFNSDNRCRVSSTGMVYPESLRSCLDDFNAGEIERNLSYIGISVGVGSAIVGAILLATAPSATVRSDRRATFRCDAVPGSLGVRCGGSF